MKNKEKKTSIGGQAVLEGVMMRGKSSMATAVRDQDGIIRLETERITPNSKKNVILRLPIIRGVVAFVQSLFGGMKTLMRSAEVYGESEPSRFEKWLAEKCKINVMSIVMTLSLVLGLALAMFLFVFLPIESRKLLEWIFKTEFNVWAKNFIEGGMKLLIFLSYILLCSLLKDIKRTFMYHGAEHKTITCYEKGLDLTVENAKTCTRVHDRCGTTFIVFVLVISILLFAVFEAFLVHFGIEVEKILRIALKLLLLPLVAGLSYELLKGLAKTNSPIFYPLKVPGLLLQRITTREPDNDMLEVALTAFKKVLEMDADESIPTQKFVVAEKTNNLLERVYNQLKENGIEEKAEAEWILSLSLNVKRDELNTDKLVSPKNVEKINALLKERITGRPLWYCFGDTDFMGYTFKVDERVLIPRPETELLVETASKMIDANSSVLDLCTGSGAIAVSIKKLTNANVTASDISEDAITLAKENAKINGVDVNFIISDLFNDIENKFDMIISNPPYIKSADINGLQREVKDFEPLIALDGGEDGLDFYRIIAKNAKNHLNEGGVLIMECGIGQAEEIKNLLGDFSTVKIIKDYEDIDRIIMAVV